MGWTIALIAGIGLVALAAALGVSEHRWLRKAAIADGKVVELVPNQSGTHRRTSYSPRVTFTAEDGSEHTFVRARSSNPPGYSVGEQVKVAYDRATGEGRILNFGERFGPEVFLAAIGLGAIMTSTTFMIGREVFARVYLK